MLRRKQKDAEQQPKKQRKWVRFCILGVSVLCIIAGVYILYVLHAPSIKPLDAAQQAAFVPDEIGEKQVIIPKIAVNVKFAEGDKWALHDGLWHQVPERGDPEKGGNFVLSGHRYIGGLTPGDTIKHSYLYNLDKLVVGDTILVDFHHKRYTYHVTELKDVKPNATEIMNPSNEAKLTLYTCTLAGPSDGRVVVIATPDEASQPISPEKQSNN